MQKHYFGTGKSQYHDGVSRDENGIKSQSPYIISTVTFQKDRLRVQDDEIFSSVIFLFAEGVAPMSMFSMRLLTCTAFLKETVRR